MWKHERSTSRANEITKKAEREMSLIEDEMDNVSELSDKYGKAVKAIGETCREVADANCL